LPGQGASAKLTQPPMNTNAPAEAPRGDTVNVLSFLVVVSLCLSLAMYAALRLTQPAPPSPQP